MRKFFVSPADIGDNIIFIDNADDVHHMTKVLRLKVGDHIMVSDSQEWEYEGEITAINSTGIEVAIVDKQKFAGEPTINVTLFQGIPKQGKMETIVQKTTEMGIKEIVPVFMARTVVVDKGNFGKKLQRWQKVADEAGKQCKRGIIPKVADAKKFKDILPALKEFDLVLIPYENEDGTTIKDVLRETFRETDTTTQSDSNAPQSIAIIIGPEGGFAEDEVAQVIDCGGKSVSLGKTILRTETAGIVALAMTMYELEL